MSIKDCTLEQTLQSEKYNFPARKRHRVANRTLITVTFPPPAQVTMLSKQTEAHGSNAHPFEAAKIDEKPDKRCATGAWALCFRSTDRNARLRRRSRARSLLAARRNRWAEQNTETALIYVVTYLEKKPFWNTIIYWSNGGAAFDRVPSQQLRLAALRGAILCHDVEISRATSLCLLTSTSLRKKYSKCINDDKLLLQGK